MNAGCAKLRTRAIPERLRGVSRLCAIQIHVYIYLYQTPYVEPARLCLHCLDFTKNAHGTTMVTRHAIVSMAMYSQITL